MRPDVVLLALDRESFERPRLDGVLDERVGGLADQDLVGVRPLREPFCEDHGLAGHECVPFRRIPGDDLPGVDPDPDLEADVK